MASYYPLPNMPTPYYGANNYASTVLQYDRADQVTVKLDQEIRQWWRASVSYLHYGSREPGNAWFPILTASPNNYIGVRHVDATQANSTLTPSPTLVVSLLLGVQSLSPTTYSRPPSTRRSSVCPHRSFAACPPRRFPPSP